MTCEENLAAQAEAVKTINPNTIFVYRNFVKALPWFTSMSKKTQDPAYSGWFLTYIGSGTYKCPSATIPGIRCAAPATTASTRSTATTTTMPPSTAARMPSHACLDL